MVARNTVPEVMIVRLSVWFSALFMISAKVPRIPSFRSSRIRSKITMVSLIEKPMIVRIAATIGALSWRPERKKMPNVFDRHFLCIVQRDGITAREISAHDVAAAVKAIADADGDEQPGADERGLGILEEVHVGGFDHVEHAELLEVSLTQERVEDNA